MINTQSYSQNIGFLTSYPVSPCLTVTITTATLSISIITVFTNPGGNLYNY